jgi:hypothetical protein
MSFTWVVRFNVGRMKWFVPSAIFIDGLMPGSTTGIETVLGTIGRSRLCRGNKTSPGMNKLIICARASALFATAASAVPLSSGLAAIPDNGIENDRMVCGQYGRCWRDRGQHVGWVERSDTHPVGDDRGGLREAPGASCDLVPDGLFHLPDGQITDSLSSPC